MPDCVDGRYSEAQERWGCAGLDKFVLVLINFFLILAVDKERESLGEIEVRDSIVTHEGLTTDDEFGGSERSVLTSAATFLISESGKVAA